MIVVSSFSFWFSLVLYMNRKCIVNKCSLSWRWTTGSEWMEWIGSTSIQVILLCILSHSFWVYTIFFVFIFIALYAFIFLPFKWFISISIELNLSTPYYALHTHSDKMWYAPVHFWKLSMYFQNATSPITYYFPLNNRRSMLYRWSAFCNCLHSFLFYDTN